MRGEHRDGAERRNSSAFLIASKRAERNCLVRSGGGKSAHHEHLSSIYNQRLNIIFLILQHQLIVENYPCLLACFNYLTEYA